MPPFLAPPSASITLCTTHRRDAFYTVNVRKRRYYVLVLGCIDLNPLPDSVLRQCLVNPSTSDQDLQEIKTLSTNVLVLYMADDNERILRKIHRSVISIEDVSLTSTNLVHAKSLEFEKRAREAIDALEYISDADKALLKSGPLGFDNQISLVRAQSLPPIKAHDTPHPLLQSNLILFETPTSRTEWKVETLPTLQSPTWLVGNTDDDSKKSLSYGDFWTILNVTVTRLGLLQASLPDDKESHYFRLRQFIAGDNHNPLHETAFPLAHSPILYRSMDGTAAKRGFVIRVCSPLGITSIVELVTAEGFVESPTLHVDSRFDDAASLESSIKAGWAVCPFGFFPAPKPLTAGRLCQLAKGSDGQVRNCHICHTTFNNLTIAQVREHYNKQHPSTSKSPPLEIPEHLQVTQCDMCRLVFATAGLLKHKKSCRERDILCPFENCGKKMTSLGDTALVHLVAHLKANHLDSDDGHAFTPTSATTIASIKQLKFCGCSNHELDEYHQTRLFTSQALIKHLKPPTPASSVVGEGVNWAKANVFVQETLNSLNPALDTFTPVWGQFRTRYFDYYANRNVFSTAFAAYDSLLDQLVSLPADDADDKATTLWFLVTYFDPLIFRGDNRLFTKKVRIVKDCINQRVAKLLNGDIEELWTSTLGKGGTAPPRPSSQTPKDVRVKQLMELGRFSDAASEATSDLKRPRMDDGAINAFRDAVIPPSLQHQPIDGVQPRSDRADPVVDPSMLTFVPESDDAQDPDIRRLKKIISSIKKGKGAGFLGDTLDFYKVIARDGDTLKNLLELLRRILRGQLPPQLRPAFNLLAGSLFVKPDTDPVAYRPIGCPSALNRLVGKFFCSITKDDISKAMLKANQFAVGVKGGMTLLLASLQLLVQQHLDFDDDFEQEDDSASSHRALFSLDLISMFNVCNLDIFFSWADKDPILSSFIPFLETMCKEPSTYILKKEDGTYAHVTQPNGCAQGTTLAPLIASFCLIILISKFLSGNLASSVSPPSEAALKNITHFAENPHTPSVIIASRRRPPEDVALALLSIREQLVDSQKSMGEPILSYMDDMSTVACYSFILAFSRFLVKHGPAAGVHVNWAKTQVFLGSHWDQRWRDVSEDGSTLRMDVDFIGALRELGIPEFNIISSPEHGPTKLAKIKGGVKILGAPFGFSHFCKAFRSKTLAKQMNSFDAISEAATDKEHLYKLIRLCVIPKVYHMFTAASSLNAIAEFAKACHAQHITFFQRFLNDGKELDSDTEHSFELATLLIRQGGIQFTSPLNFYKAGFLASWSKLFFVGSPPSPDSDEPIQSPIHPSIAQIIEAQLKAPTLLCCVDYSRCFQSLEQMHPLDFGKEVAGGKGMAGLILAAAADKLQHTIVEATSRNRFQDLYNTLIAKEDSTGAKSHLRKIMPSSAQFLSSHYLDNLNMGGGKMSSETFLCYTKMKLGLPILDIKAGETLDCPFCSKKNVLNRFGDHIFSCYYFMSHRTTCMHNPFRDTVAHVLGKLSKIGAPKASYISSVTIEKTGLVPNTALRPADVFATFSSEKHVLNQEGQKVAVKAVAFDITYTTPSETKALEGFRNTSSFRPAAFPHLLKAEATKRGDTHDGRTIGGTAQYLAERSIAFVPMAVDCMGGMGSQLSLLLFDSHTGRRPERAQDGKPCRVPAVDLAVENWVTPDRMLSDDPTLHLPPFHPPSLNGQFKAAIDHLKKSADPGEEPDVHQAHAIVHQLALTLSTCHVNGVGVVARIFGSSIEAAKGRSPKLPSLSNSEPYVEGEVSKAVDFINRSYSGDDSLVKHIGECALDGQVDRAATYGDASDGLDDFSGAHLPRSRVQMQHGSISPLAHLDDQKGASGRSVSHVLSLQSSDSGCHYDSACCDDDDDGSALLRASGMGIPSKPLCQMSANARSSDADAFVNHAVDVRLGHMKWEEVRPQLIDNGIGSLTFVRGENRPIWPYPEPLLSAAGLLAYPGDMGQERGLPCSARAGLAPAYLPVSTGPLVPRLTTATTSSSPRRLGVTSSRQALLVAYALRHLVATPGVFVCRMLHTLIDDHRLHVPVRFPRDDPRRLARCLLQILDVSFASVAALPRDGLRTHQRAEYLALPNATLDEDCLLTFFAGVASLSLNTADLG